MNIYSPVISGSLTVTGSTNFLGNVVMSGSLSFLSGSLTGTASNSSLLDGTGSLAFATTSSFATTSGSVSSRLTQIETVYATTGSNSFRANQSITGSLTVTGQIIAQTLNVQQVTSSILYSSGSNNFGCDINSRQTFTGSFYQTGSVAVFSGCVGIGTISPATALHVSGSGDTTVTIGVSGANNPRLKFCGGGGVINRSSACDTLYFGEAADSGNYLFRGTGVSCFGNDVCVQGNGWFKGTGNYNTVNVDNTSATGGGGIYLRQNGVVAGGVGVSGWYDGNTACDMLVISETGKNIRFYTNGANERMRITSAGFVTRPNQPFVYGGISGDQLVGTTGGSILNFTTNGAYSFYNCDTTGCWNNSTYTFTVPIAGMYLINASIYQCMAGYINQIALYIDGVRKQAIPVRIQACNGLISGGSAMIPLTAGQALTLRSFNDIGNVCLLANVYHTWFSIYML